MSKHLRQILFIVSALVFVAGFFMAHQKTFPLALGTETIWLHWERSTLVMVSVVLALMAAVSRMEWPLLFLAVLAPLFSGHLWLCVVGGALLLGEHKSPAKLFDFFRDATFLFILGGATFTSSAVGDYLTLLGALGFVLSWTKEDQALSVIRTLLIIPAVSTLGHSSEVAVAAVSTILMVQFGAMFLAGNKHIAFFQNSIAAAFLLFSVSLGRDASIPLALMLAMWLVFPKKSEGSYLGLLQSIPLLGFSFWFPSLLWAQYGDILFGAPLFLIGFYMCMGGKNTPVIKPLFWTLWLFIPLLVLWTGISSFFDLGWPTLYTPSVLSFRDGELISMQGEWRNEYFLVPAGMLLGLLASWLTQNLQASKLKSQIIHFIGVRFVAWSKVSRGQSLHADPVWNRKEIKSEELSFEKLGMFYAILVLVLILGWRLSEWTQ